MSQRSPIQDLRRARDAHDPDLTQQMVLLVEQPDPTPDTPPRDGVPTLQKFLKHLRSREFRKLPHEQQSAYRVEQWKALESPNAEAPLAPRMQTHELLLDLWTTNDVWSRTRLLELIAELPLVYGPWRALKQIFKEAEAKDDHEVLGALAARIDEAFACSRKAPIPDSGPVPVGTLTLGYLARRAWRVLRRIGQTLPACYPDAACAFLARYSDNVYWPNTWIANHIFYHETGKYGRTRFHLPGRGSDLLKNRAFADAWKRSPRPLFSLLERAQAEQVRQFAVDSLKADFRASLREVEPGWIVRLIGVGSESIDDFVVWILKNVPQFEQSRFRELGLHDAVLRLFDSDSGDARTFAAEYVRTHARDIPLELLIRLADNNHGDVQKLVIDLIKERDPRKAIGLDGWGRLLETDGAHEVAAEMLRKHFTASDLTKDWFRNLLKSGRENGLEFAIDNLTKLHPVKSLGPDFFLELLEHPNPSRNGWLDHHLAQYVVEEIEKFDLNALDPKWLKLLLLHPHTRSMPPAWVSDGKLKASTVPVEFLKTLAFRPDWDASPEIAAFKQTEWGRSIEFDEPLSLKVLAWLSDVRTFSPADLTFEWLLKLVQRSEPQYHDFAVETMTKVFLPADFAPKDEAPAAAQAGKSEAITVDLGGASFLFTGKLSTMTRDEAEGKVTVANGSNASSVSPKLNYLVIGDDGSPLYGQGRKGSKQTKAESLIAGGAAIKIISETAFLQMLVGGKREFSTNQVQAGCERLWQMLTAEGPEDAPLRKFARQYIRRHHSDICLKETDRPVDPGAEIPPEFLSFERLKPIFFEKRKLLRDFALELAGWEFARWSPPIEGLVELSEAPSDEVREFVAKALTADDLPDNKRFRLNADVLTAAAVYSFCESKDPATRMLGMHLIEKNPRLQLPEELFQLTESPDRKVRAFVIRAFWSLYRGRGITADWKPQPPPVTTIGKKAKEKAAQAVKDVGPGAPKLPENPPAPKDDLRDLLRRILFEIPPGRPEKPATGTIATKLKPLPTRKSKLLLVETLRDMALEDREFSAVVLPLLEEFLKSSGASEFAACCVAVTRLKWAQSTP